MGKGGEGDGACLRWAKKFHSNFQTLRFLFAFPSMIVYIVLFANNHHIAGPPGVYMGLWVMENSTESESDANSTETPEDANKGTIPVGSSPAYFEAARTLACFAMVFNVATLLVCYKEHSVTKFPVFIHGLAGLFGVICCVLVGENYKDDERVVSWGGDSSLGWCQYVLRVWAGVVILLAIGQVVWLALDKRLPKPGEVAPNRPVVCQRRPSTFSVVSIGEGKTMTIFKADMYPPSHRLPLAGPGHFPSAPPGDGRGFPTGGTANQAYDLASEPGFEPPAALPSYQDVLRADQARAGLSTPRVVTPSKIDVKESKQRKTYA